MRKESVEKSFCGQAATRRLVFSHSGITSFSGICLTLSICLAPGICLAPSICFLSFISLHDKQI